MEQIKSAIRTLLKVVGASLATKGVVDDATLEAIIGGVVAAIGAVWSYYQHKSKPDASANAATQ